MLAEQVGGHTPTLEGFRWRHDALPRRAGGLTMGPFCGLLLCSESICYAQGKHEKEVIRGRLGIWIDVYITRRQPQRLLTDTL